MLCKDVILLLVSGKFRKIPGPTYVLSITSSDGVPMSYGIETRGSKAVKLRSSLSRRISRTEIVKILASDVQRLDRAIHNTNHYPADKCHQNELS